jgi:hypothetical protein
MLIKRTTPGAYDFGCAAVEQIKTASAGLRGHDLQQLIKRAGHQFVDAMRNVRLGPGEVPIHLLAIGATEFYGPNRNGDGFKCATCRKFYKTFETKPLTKEGAYWYRNHQNKDPQKSYGVVKLAAFNEAMKRIELLVALNSTKEAADRNGGLVADKEMEKLARGESDWGVSMACRVPFDVCSGCGNQARTRAEYCREDTCKYGGCTNNLTKVADDGHILHVDNPSPTWFDISDVYRPADRIAYVMGEMQKAASGRVIGGAEAAELYGLTVPPYMRYAEVDERTARLIKLSYDMADLEQDLAHGKMTESILDRPIRTNGYKVIEVSPVLKDGVWQAMTAEKIALSYRSWANFRPAMPTVGVLTKTASAPDATDCLPGVFGRLVGDGDNLERMLADRSCDPGRAVASERERNWAAKIASEISISRKHIGDRGVREVIQDTPRPSLRRLTKSAAGGAETLARQYAVYQLYFLDELRNDPDQPLYRELIVKQNGLG